ncbi:MAG: hypothetical protein OXG81_13635 [Acidobacteria bacterium]|nr:hypothetical protein [Acidobacteriota bacterium]
MFVSAVLYVERVYRVNLPSLSDEWRKLHSTRSITSSAQEGATPAQGL